jgi:hypothetical protein
VERWRPYDEQSDGTLYAHRSCFAACLHPEIRELFEDEGDEQPRTEVPISLASQPCRTWAPLPGSDRMTRWERATCSRDVGTFRRWTCGVRC